MDFKTFKQYNAMKKIKIEEVDLLDKNPDLLYQADLRKSDTKPDFKKETLEKYKILMPVLITDELMQIPHELGYESYSHYVDYDVVFNSGHVMQINQLIGIRFLNPSDEKYYKTRITKPIPIYLLYDFEEKRWKKTDSKKTWKKERDFIRSFFNNKDWIQIQKDYAEKRKNKEKYSIFSLLKSMLRFFNVKHMNQELSDKHYSLMKNQIRNELKKLHEKIEKLKDNPNYSDTNFIIEKNGLIKTFKKTIFSNPGYWIIHDTIYPDIAAYHHERERSEESRTPDTKRLQKIALIKTANQQKFTYIRLDEPNFKNKLDSLK